MLKQNLNWLRRPYDAAELLVVAVVVLVVDADAVPVAVLTSVVPAAAAVVLQLHALLLAVVAEVALAGLARGPAVAALAAVPAAVAGGVAALPRPVGVVAPAVVVVLRVALVLPRPLSEGDVDKILYVQYVTSGCVNFPSCPANPRSSHGQTCTDTHTSHTAKEQSTVMYRARLRGSSQFATIFCLELSG